MNFFSNSTSRLIIPRWKRPNAQQAAQQDTLATAGKYASTEGHFSIIDKRHKESASMESSDSSSDDDLVLNYKKSAFTKTKYEHRISFRSSTATTASSKQQQQSGLQKSKQISTSRFRIVPVESCYERGRWACWDFYNAEPTKERHTSPSRLFSSSSNGLSTRSFRKTFNSSMFTPIHNVPHTAPPNDQQSVTFSFDFAEKSDTDHHSVTKTLCNGNTSQQISSQHSISPNKTAKISLKNDITNQTKSNIITTELAISGRMTPVEMLNNFGLERSLTATYNDNLSVLGVLPDTKPLVGNSGTIKSNNCGKVESSPACGTVVTASGAGTNTPIIAIDGKIEQAMDLVKTHLMFAVREEVDVLRAKIIELEATILQLEAENAILREHVPVEILNKLSLQTTPPNSSTTTAAV